MHSTKETPLSQPTPDVVKLSTFLLSSKKEAHALLDAQRAGVPTPHTLVTQALLITGDLKMGVAYDF